MRQFKLSTSPHGQMCIQAHDLSRAECYFIRGIVCNQHMNSADYKVMRPVGAFLQGFDEPRGKANDGWVLVEFWSEDKPANALLIT